MSARLATNTFTPGVRSRSAGAGPVRIVSSSRSANRAKVEGLPTLGADLRAAAVKLGKEHDAMLAAAVPGIVSDARARMAAKPDLGVKSAALIRQRDANTIAYGAGASAWRQAGFAMGMEFGAGRRTSSYVMHTKGGPRPVVRTMDYGRVFGAWRGNHWTPGYGPDGGIGYAIYPAIKAAADRLDAKRVGLVDVVFDDIASGG